MYPGTCTFEFKFVQQVKDKNMGEGELGISAKEGGCDKGESHVDTEFHGPAC